MKKIPIIFLLLGLFLITSNVMSSQQDSIYKNFRSIKTLTLGEKPVKDRDIYYNYEDNYRSTTLSLGNLERVNVRIFTNDSGLIYKLAVEHTCIHYASDDSCMEEMKEFRLLLENYYGLNFRMLPVETETSRKNIFDKELIEFVQTKYVKKKYMRVATKPGTKFSLETTNIESYSKSSKNLASWGIMFSMTDIELEKKKQQEEIKKNETIKEKAKSNF